MLQVIGTWQDILHMAPARGKHPQEPEGGVHRDCATHRDADTGRATHQRQPSCGQCGVAGREWLLARGEREVRIRRDEATTVNAAGSCGTVGLRFSPNAYPGSSATMRTDLGGGQWHMYTQPWPNNIGYCANGSTVTYWHVSLDMIVQVVAG